LLSWELGESGKRVGGTEMFVRTEEDSSKRKGDEWVSFSPARNMPQEKPPRQKKTKTKKERTENTLAPKS